MHRPKLIIGGVLFFRILMYVFRRRGPEALRLLPGNWKQVSTPRRNRCHGRSLLRPLNLLILLSKIIREGRVVSVFTGMDFAIDILW